MRPDQVVSMLNSYFSALVDVLESHGGVVTQFQGDAIFATFNVPLADPDHAAQAVRAACRIQEVLKKQVFEGHWLKCRIGINTGVVTAGAVGAAGRLSYTVHGDAVNLAARLEVLNKEYGTRILLSEFTAAYLDSSEFRLRSMGTAMVRGKTQSVALLSPESDAEDTDTPSTICCS
jgi:adenylate cyclase